MTFCAPLVFATASTDMIRVELDQRRRSRQGLQAGQFRCGGGFRQMGSSLSVRISVMVIRPFWRP
ncbi:MAG: FIG00454169: hypothetical protein [uncultured Paraburkholderia sp.]|nr:MAG: FIG00454169: hypothetical protein [uncultured Paraburkholderia sp.]